MKEKSCVRCDVYANNFLTLDSSSPPVAFKLTSWSFTIATLILIESFPLSNFHFDDRSSLTPIYFRTGRRSSSIGHRQSKKNVHVCFSQFNEIIKHNISRNLLVQASQLVSAWTPPQQRYQESDILLMTQLSPSNMTSDGAKMKRRSDDELLTMLEWRAKEEIWDNSYIELWRWNPKMVSRLNNSHCVCFFSIINDKTIESFSSFGIGNFFYDFYFENT